MQEQWFVVCTDLHGGCGPFTEAEALATAAKMTAEGGCVYVPTLMFVQADQPSTVKFSLN